MTHRSLILGAALVLLAGCVGTPPATRPASRPTATSVPAMPAPHTGTNPARNTSGDYTSQSPASSGNSQGLPVPGESAGATPPFGPAGNTAATGQMPPPPPREVLAAIGDAQPRAETRTRRGNPPVYSVLGQTYQLLRSAAGYRERGVASWYGPDFHAKNTANGEAYDMYAMTAAHRTLPIPVYLKVTNLANGKSVVVRVNDRGPFKHNRIIDLSYTAAMKLDMLNKGTALVEVEAILPPGDDGLLPEMTPELAASAPRAPSVPKLAALATGGLLYAQVGAFGVEANAFGLRDRLNVGGIKNVLVVRVARDGKPLWRVRIGPIASVDDYDA
ncbi:MAG: hypothetical protein RJB26_1493, partial [Pseudomonadota bacterium]